MKSVLYLLLALGLALHGCKDKKTGKEAGTMPVPEVLVNTPLRQTVTYTYEYPAHLEAMQTVNLVGRVSGFLEKIHYAPGQHVKAGTVLFVVEPQPYLDQLQAAQAQMESSTAKLNYAKAQYEKMKEAMPGKAVSEIDYIQAESGYQSAQAGLMDAKAQLDIARTNLDYCYIKAPFEGRVTRNLVDMSNFINGSVQPVTLATMYRDKAMYAYFNMAYPEFQNLPPVGNNPTLLPLSITDASDPGKKWQGSLDYTAPNVDLQTGTVTVRAIVPNPEEELLSGMYVKINVPYKEVPDALLIPEASVGTNQSGRFAYVVGKDGRVELRPLKTGILTPEGMREIVGGLAPDDRYVVEALMSVRPGMKVDPVTSKTPSQTSPQTKH